MTFPAAEAEAHLRALAGKVRLEWVPTIGQAYAQGGRWPVVYTPRPTTALKYGVGLHELGHILHPDGLSILDSDDSPFVGEACAWAWAAKHWHPDLLAFRTERLRRSIVSLLVTHLEWPEPRGGPES